MKRIIIFFYTILCITIFSNNGEYFKKYFLKIFNGKDFQVVLENEKTEFYELSNFSIYTNYPYNDRFYGNLNAGIKLKIFDYSMIIENKILEHRNKINIANIEARKMNYQYIKLRVKGW
ncbi:hypothetical protein [Marinitoga sp. 1155]|uniref:hypothetical protein n=1 Tax=Marinitoga sp. 1155 TaxID=1428448 RepID=UPI0006418564|nr:hypothetical protein [Marinitoga sp. 1155]KLO24166.1 hypothetical protein X274_04835 [Marinitoga sp. 1155]